jgi:hypothetical protein
MEMNLENPNFPWRLEVVFIHERTIEAWEGVNPK